MIYPLLQTPFDIRNETARKAKACRLRMNMTQQELAERSGVSLASLRRFEQTGEISYYSLLKLAWILSELTPFTELFPEPDPRMRSMYDPEPPKRLRGSSKKKRDTKMSPLPESAPHS